MSSIQILSPWAQWIPTIDYMTVALLSPFLINFLSASRKPSRNLHGPSRTPAFQNALTFPSLFLGNFDLTVLQLFLTQNKKQVSYIYIYICVYIYIDEENYVIVHIPNIWVSPGPKPWALGQGLSPSLGLRP